jgi:hypothetical protein
MAATDGEEIEHFFDCPYCAETISVLIDPSAPGQEYVEDCEVCCRPIQLSYEIDDGSIADFVAVKA